MSMKTRDRQVYTNLAAAVHRMWERYLETDSHCFLVQDGAAIIVTSKPHNQAGRVMAGTSRGGSVR